MLTPEIRLYSYKARLLRGMVSIAACRLHLGISHAQARYKNSEWAVVRLLLGQY
jgi:hypothetical protein